MRPIPRGKYMINDTGDPIPKGQTVTSAAPSAGAGSTLATLVLSWITPGRCHIQQSISQHLET